MLGVVIANGDKQLVIDLPASSAAMQAELASIDITVPIESVLLSDEEGEKIRIKLYASTPSSAHLLRLLTPDRSLADANLCAGILQEADTIGWSYLEHGLQADSFRDLDDYMTIARRMLNPYVSGIPLREDDFGVLHVLSQYENNPSIRLIVSCTHGEKVEYFPMPMNDAQLISVFQNHPGLADENHIFRIEKSRLPDSWTERFYTILKNKGLFFLNFWMEYFPFGEDIGKYEAVLEYAEVSEGRDIESSSELVALARRLDLFDFLPNCKDDADLACHWIHENIYLQLSSELREFFDFEAYGKHLREVYDGLFVSSGFVSMPIYVRLETVLDDTYDPEAQ